MVGAESWQYNTPGDLKKVVGDRVCGSVNECVYVCVFCVY